MNGLILFLLSLSLSEDETFRNVVEKAQACVVAIRVERDEPYNPAFTKDVFARRPLRSWCSGTVIDPEGFILTTHFNVAGTVKSIKVRLSDGREVEGKLVGYDGEPDLALIKVDVAGLPALPPSPLKELKTGARVVALGRAPDGKGITANPGIVSSPTALAGRALQTDARLNFGNVGGPLVDLSGRLVAVTCKVDTASADDRGQNSGVGYAVPHDRLGEIVLELKKGRKRAESRRPFLGIQSNPQTEAEGLEITAVIAGGAAEKAGLKSGDLIVSFEGVAVKTFDDFMAAILRRSPGDRVRVKVKRAAEEKELHCILGSHPDD